MRSILSFSSRVSALGGPWVERALLLALSASIVASAGDIARAVAESRQGAGITIAIAAVVLLAALLSSIAGFAFSALVGGALAYFGLSPVSMVQTIVVCSCAIQLYAVWKLRASMRWRPLWMLLVGGIATVPLGVWLLVHLDAAHYAAGLGLLLIGYGGYALMRGEAQAARPVRWTALLAGALGGVTGGLAGLPGVSVTIWCSRRGWDKVQQRAVYQPYILAMQLLSLSCLRWQSPSQAAMASDLVFVPFALFGAIGGFALFQRMNSRQFHVATSVLLLASGVGLVARVF
jgi:uncharacterized membrane protein YfcA